MILNIRNFIKAYGVRIRTKIDVDSDFYDTDVFYLIDLEG